MSTQIWYWYSNVLYIHIISYFNIKFGLFCCQCQPKLCGVSLLLFSTSFCFSHQLLQCFTSSPRPCGANGSLHSSVAIEVSFDCLEPWGVLRCRHVAMVKTCSKHKHIKRKRMDTQRLEPQWMQSCYDLNHLWNDVCFFFCFVICNLQPRNMAFLLPKRNGPC